MVNVDHIAILYILLLYRILLLCALAAFYTVSSNVLCVNYFFLQRDDFWTCLLANADEKPRE